MITTFGTGYTGTNAQKICITFRKLACFEHDDSRVWPSSHVDCWPPYIVYQCIIVYHIPQFDGLVRKSARCRSGVSMMGVVYHAKMMTSVGVAVQMRPWCMGCPVPWRFDVCATSLRLCHFSKIKKDCGSTVEILWKHCGLGFAGWARISKPSLCWRRKTLCSASALSNFIRLYHASFC